MPRRSYRPSSLHQGEDLEKPTWSARLITPRGGSRIDVSKDFVRMTIAMPLLVGLGLLGIRLPR